MLILTLNPSDVIKRCLWSNYKKFILNDKSEDAIRKIVEDDKPITISEEDAYVIGLLKVVETENLIHRFKTDMEEVISIKSTILQDRVFMNKGVIIKEILTYKNHFPEYFKADGNYKKSIAELNSFINELHKSVEKLTTTQMTLRQGGVEKNITFLNSNDIIKLIKY
jgi:hypothetical protein